MGFRDDHEAALHRVTALETDLERAEHERDRFQAELEATRRAPARDAERMEDLERQLAAAIAERDNTRAELDRLRGPSPPDALTRRDAPGRALAVGLGGCGVGAMMAAAVESFVGLVVCIAVAVGLVRWFMRARRRG